MMNVQNEEVRQRLIKRLNRIEGQVRGVSRMLSEDRDCQDIVQQVAAIRSAIQQVGLEVTREYARQCLADSDSTLGDDEVIDYLVDTLGKWA